nr:PREDICTED: putative ferric-chelate reductase 1 isoform X2 [Latimeria chalumnae]|eukprot:XP_014346259.1 PREDICTED: putative ferric-chelate reductase 1 isoform X2 [Latimeria chalumnae]
MHPAMELHRIGLVFCILASVLELVASYANGKVTEACRSMKPRHGGTPKPLPSVHTMTVDKTEFNPGDQIKVVLSGPSFRGFFIQAHDAANIDSDAVGSFILLDGKVSQLLTCGHNQHSAVSHTSSSGKVKIEVLWNAPSNAPPHVQFVFTVVMEYYIYWVKVPGPKISQPNAPPLPIHIVPSSLPVTTESVAQLNKSFTAIGCGSSKFCVRDPSDCDPEKNPKCFFLSFLTDNCSLVIEMSGPGNGYVSFALSHDKWMGDDDTYLCVKVDQEVQIYPAYATGRTRPIIGMETSLREKAWRFAEGVIQCSFRRNIHIPAHKNRFDLDQKYYIFLADGRVERGVVHRHHHQPLITAKKFNVTGSPESIGGSRSPLIIKTHGALMFIAWMTTVSIGVLVARFFKPIWPDTVLFGEKIWFQVHRTLMMFTVLLTCTAFVLPFIYRGGWSKHAGAHPFLGCTVMILTVLQPIMAVFRPLPQNPRRIIFNRAHWGTGTVARIIAVAAMFLGMDLQELDLPDPWDSLVLTGFIVWHVLTDITLEAHGYFINRKAKPAEEDQSNIVDSIGSTETTGHSFRKKVLAIYICGNIAFLITFLVAINRV